MSDIKDRIAKARLMLCHEMPFFGHLALMMTLRPAKDEDRVPTMAVTPDGTMIYNEAYVSGLTDANLMADICHEVLHPALGYWSRMQGRTAIAVGSEPCPSCHPGATVGQPGPGVAGCEHCGGRGHSETRVAIWNLAHDYSFNPMIVEAGLDLKAPYLADKKYSQWSAEEIYDDLVDNMPKAQQAAGIVGVAEPGDGDGQQGLHGDCRPDLSESEDGKKAAAGEKGAQTKLENDWKVGVAAAAQVHEKEKGRGKLPGGLQKYVDDLLDPKVDWGVELSRWLGEHGRRHDYTYARPGRRSESVGEYMPSTEKYGTPDVVILWDTSGSMNGMETEILSEVNGICEDLDLSLRIIVCDAAVHADVDDIKSAQDVIDRHEEIVRGGGGSDFTPAFDRLKDFDGVVVAFTDGHIGVPATKPYMLKGCLWVLQCDSDVDPTGGRWGEVLWAKIRDHRNAA